MKKNIFTTALVVTALTALLFSCTVQDPAATNTTVVQQVVINTEYNFEIAKATNNIGSGSGNIEQTLSTANGLYKVETQITAAAVAAYGSSFVGWYDEPTAGNLVSTEATFSFKLKGNTGLYARFAESNISFPDPVLNSHIRQSIGVDASVQLTYDMVNNIKTVALDGQSLSQKIASLKGLENLTALKTLKLPNHSITELSPLSQATSLRDLELNSNGITNISALANLKKLTSLSINSNNISHIFALETMSALEALDLGGNQVTNISPLKKLKHLRNLSLWDNPANLDITPLSSMLSLKSLTLHGITPGDVSAIGNLTGLTHLMMSRTSITNPDSLSNLVNLEALDLRASNISDISFIEKMTSLNQVYLSSNPVSNIDPLINNEGLGAGDTLYIRNWNLTPAQEQSLMDKEITLNKSE